MSIPTNNIQALCPFIHQAIASAIAASGSESILAASIILLAAAAIVFTTFALTSIRCLVDTLPAILFFVSSAICGLLKSSWHIVNSKAAVRCVAVHVGSPSLLRHREGSPLHHAVCC